MQRIKHYNAGLQGSLLAGGIAAGAVAVTQLQPWAAICLGLVLGAAVISAGLYCEPRAWAGLRLPPAYSTLSVHGLPALLGGLLGILLAGLAEERAGLLNYGLQLYRLYPGRAPGPGWSCPAGLASSGDEVRSLVDPNLPALHRSATGQAAWQLAALITTALLAGAGGAGAGLAVRLAGGGGAGMPPEAWYDGSCFLAAPAPRPEESRNSREEHWPLAAMAQQE